MHLKNFVMSLVFCFQLAPSVCQQNHVYASTIDLQNLQLKFINFLQQIGHKKVSIFEELNVEDPTEAFMFLRYLLSDLSKVFKRFQKSLIKNQVT